MIFFIALASIIISGTVAYIIVVCVVLLDKEFRRQTACVFLFNLILVDTINLLLVMPFSLPLLRQTWQPDALWITTCLAFMTTTTETASVLSLALVSFDRLVAVHRPFVYSAHMTKKRAVQLCFYTWIQALIFALVPVPLRWYGFNTRFASFTFDESNTSCYHFTSFVVIFFICNTGLSFLVIFASNVYICRVSRRHRRTVRLALVPSFLLKIPPPPQTSAKRMAIKIFLVVGSFVVCHFPYASVRMLEPLSRGTLIATRWTVATKWLSFAQSALDPFVYFMLQKKFQKVLSRSLRSVFLRNQVLHEEERVIPHTRIRRNAAVATIHTVNTVEVDC